MISLFIPVKSKGISNRELKEKEALKSSDELGRGDAKELSSPISSYLHVKTLWNRLSLYADQFEEYLVNRIGLLGTWTLGCLVGSSLGLLIVLAITHLLTQK